MQIETFVISPLRSNCYVVSEHEAPGADAIVIDPGDTAVDEIIHYVRTRRLHLTGVWNTHGHFDHVMGVDKIRHAFNVPVYLHEADLPLWDNLPESADKWLARSVPPLARPDHFLSDGETLQLGHIVFSVWHTPGHSPGSVCFVTEELAFTGDTLFAGTIGRTDFAGSDPVAMQDSLRRLQQLPDEVVIYPGHDRISTIGAERANNPFFGREFMK
jgi:hydroxyacylglutathione hydrolase